MRWLVDCLSTANDMTRRHAWLGVLLAAQLVSAPVYAQWDWTGGGGPRDWTGAAPPPPPVDDGVWVTLHSHGRPVQIERVVGEASYPVCTAPCRQKLPRNAIYRIGGEGVVPSANFDLTQEQWGGVSLDVHPASSASRNVGLVLGLGGVIALFVGGELQQQSDSATYPASSPSHQEQVASAILLGSGLLVGLVGLGFLLTSNTHVHSSNGVSF